MSFGVLILNQNMEKKLDRPFLKGKNKNVIILMKDDLGGKILKQFTTLRPKTYKYLIWRQ